MEEEKKSKETINEEKELKAQVIEGEKQEDNIEVKNESRTYKQVENFEEEEKRFDKKKSKAWIFIVTALIIVLAILSTGFALINMNNSNIIAGVKIDEINLQGLSKEDAKSVINKKIEEKLSQEIKIKVDEEEYTLALSQIELKYNVDEAVEQAYNIGRGGNIFVNNFKILKSKILGTNIEIKKEFNEELLNSFINEINSKIPNGVKQATYCIEGETLIITKGTDGLTIDTDELKQEIINNANLSNLKEIVLKTKEGKPEPINIEKIYEEVHTEAKDAYYTTNPFTVIPEVNGIDFDLENAKKILEEDKEEYEIPVIITKPNKTVKDIGTSAFPDRLSTFKTRYNASLTSRTNNLKLAANKINGTVVMPGEIFSYNKTVGKRTVEAGFTDAAGYQGGKVVDMIGGGICQISSTLYDAVVYANLEIVERHNHMFLTSYVGAGKDATVVYGRLDFRFKNTRNYPIMIKTSVQSGIAQIDIYGIKEEKEYEIEISSTILSYIPYSVVYEDNPNWEVGREKVTQGGSQGCKSKTYKIMKLNGVEVSRTVLSTDTYDPMNKYITRGTKQTTPSTPETPTTPTEPSTPSTPSEPETPTTPSEPSTPTTPTEPETPTEPTTPGAPEEGSNETP